MNSLLSDLVRACEASKLGVPDRWRAADDGDIELHWGDGAAAVYIQHHPLDETSVALIGGRKGALLTPAALTAALNTLASEARRSPDRICGR